MKKITYILITLVLFGLVTFKLYNNKKTAESKVFHFDKEMPVQVQADTLKLQPIKAERYFTGTFEPEKEVKISAETQGKIKSFLVDIGSYVKKGQPLVKIDDALLQLQLQSISVQIEGLEADVKRYSVLAEADAIQGVQLEKAELGLKSAKVQYHTLQEQIARTNITAPFSGIVTMKFTESGAHAAPGIPLLQITDNSALRFTVNVPETDLPLFRLNQEYPVTADAFSNLNLHGKTILIGSKANMGNSFPVQFSVANTPDEKIKSGMFGRVLISGKEPGEALIIPSSAVIGSDIEPKVYIVKNNRAVLQKISITQQFENSTVVGDGLNPEDIIITSGFINIYDGAPIAIKN
ncbi:MAG: efflux RND transporter periplasmic adaptor subunit [Chitinophagaceae bacterium]|nr:efflux RND transporter periplasmic adaptor subunit [Chitinophagaceae bacterium]